jgi:hypothetical protein
LPVAAFLLASAAGGDEHRFLELRHAAGICRIMTAVGVSSRKASGLSAAISAIPASRRNASLSPG